MQPKTIITDATKQKLKEMWLPLLHLVVMMVCIKILYIWFPSFWIIMVVVAVFETAKQVLGRTFQIKRWLKGLIIMCITLYTILWIVKISVKWGIVGFVLVCVALAMWRLFGSKQKRKKYIDSLRDIERQMYGYSREEMQDMKRNKEFEP